KKRRGSRRDEDQADIDGPVDALPGMTPVTFSQMGLVVDPHFGCKPTDVIAPAGKNVPDHTVCALRAHVVRYAISAREVAWWDYSVIAGSGSACDANKSRRSRSNSRCWIPSAFSAAMRAISG